jgi:predicted transcriptional regulator
MKKVIINAKGSPELKEALRIVAFNTKTSASKIIIEALENIPLVANELKKIQKLNK